MNAMRDASKSVIMGGFFEEVQRRKVYRVAAAYIIAAGFIIQIGSAVFPAWELPNWAFRLVVVLLLIGFPIALISRPGLRRHATRDSRNSDDVCAWSPPPPQFNHADCDWSDCFGGRRFFPFAARCRA
jgi:hypothetical protein